MRSISTYSSGEIRRELRDMVSLSIPVVIAQLSQMSMGFVDTFMVADLGAKALASVGVGNVIYFFYLVFSFGTLTAVNPMVAQAYGAGDQKEIGRSVGQGLWLALGLTIFGFVVAWNVEPLLLLANQEPAVAALAADYTWAMSWGIPATLSFVVFRGYCDGVSLTRVAMVISFVAVAVNVFADYVLIYGKLGMPALGATGAGWATAIVRWSMLLLIVLFLWGRPEHRRYRFLYRARIPRPRYLVRMLKLGLPIGAGFAMENGAFGMTSLLMGLIGTVALAAHQVSIVLAAVAFMIPLGTSFAVTTRVGQMIGRGDPKGAALAGWVGIIMGSGIMLITASVFVAFPHVLARTFTDDPPVVAYASQLLVLAGIFQISDGIQILAQGALRGLKDATIPMITNFVSYWVFGIPLGALLAFEFDLGGPGLWWGFVAGLSLAAVLHTVRFGRLVRNRQ